jgi:hypothetical protein
VEATRGEPVGKLAALQVGREVGIRATRKDHHSGAGALAALRLEDGERGRVLAGIALGLGGVAGPQSDGLDAEKGIVVSGRRAGFLLRQRRRGQQPESQYCENLFH